MESLTGVCIFRLPRSIVSIDLKISAAAPLTWRIRSMSSKTCRPSTCVMMSPDLSPATAAGVAGTMSSIAAPKRPFWRSLIGQRPRRDAQKAIVRQPARLERVERPLKVVIDRNRKAAGPLVAIECGERGGQADHFALEIEERAAAGAEFQFGVGLNQRAPVVQRFAAFARARAAFRRRRLALEIGDDAPGGARLAVAGDRVGIAEGDDELPLLRAARPSPNVIGCRFSASICSTARSSHGSAALTLAA